MDAFVAMQHPLHAWYCPSWTLGLNTMGAEKTARGNAQTGCQSWPTSIGQAIGRQQNREEESNGS